MQDPSTAVDPRPWYRFPLVWMVISGPACVVVAGFATLWIAIRIPDPVIADSASPHVVVPDQRLMPALVGRNHAASPGVDMPLAKPVNP